MDKQLKKIEKIAIDAGEAIMQIYQSDDFDIEQKSDQSPLTKADLASHRLIVAALQKLTPEIPLLSEESAEISYQERSQWQQYWLVDPLDGTKEFIKKNGEFTVNIALIENGISILSVVYVPAQEITYSAAKGEGAFKCQNGKRQSINAVKNARFKPTVVGSRSHAGAELTAYLQRLGQHDLVSMGSSLKFCLIAEGKADLYPRLGPTSEWDTAAAQCIVEQAGGKVVTLDGNPLRYNSKESLLNPHFMVYADDSKDWVNI